MTRHLILGTAGHIDHGKTALVKALTGVDTDRLKEEKERGITIDLGFAEWAGEGVHLGIVDVPGHEGFVRNMLAGATGMDVVLLVVAADEGVMPQTREHLAIVSLLGVRSLVVALTKIDLVEPAWLELVRDEVREALSESRLADAEIVATSARSGDGLPELGEALIRAAAATPDEGDDDVTRLPIDRVFTVRGTGTVVTGTLWSGVLRVGQRVGVVPGGPEARIRGLQAHGRDVQEAGAGTRTAVALTGAGVDRANLERGHALVDDTGWPSTTMLTVRLTLLGQTSWVIERNQRVRVHLGTAEVMARVVLLDGGDLLAPGQEGWAQLRLEAPVVARTGERLVVRSYSPVTTIGGGIVVEPFPPKRTDSDRPALALFPALLESDPGSAIAAAVELAGPGGVETRLVPLVTGFTRGQLEAALERPDDRWRSVGAALVSSRSWVKGRALIEAALDDYHGGNPLRPGATLESLRAVLPRGSHPQLADVLLGELATDGRIRIENGVASRPAFVPRPDDRQREIRDRLEATYRRAALAPPAIAELPPELGSDPDLWPLLRMLEEDGALVALADDLFIWGESLAEAERRVREEMAGRKALGPADFRDTLPVSRKHLMPLLAHLDRAGITIRRESGRDVPATRT